MHERYMRKPRTGNKLMNNEPTPSSLLSAPTSLTSDLQPPISTPAPSTAPKRGRPRKLDDLKRHEICALVAGGCSLREAAKYVGCGINTVRRELERNTEFNGDGGAPAMDFRVEQGLPVVTPAELTPDAIRAAFAAYGCLHVPGLVDEARVEELKNGIDNVFDAAEKYEEAEEAAKASEEGNGAPARPEPDPALMRAADVPWLVGDSSRLRAATGWRPALTLEQTLKDVVDAQAH